MLQGKYHFLINFLTFLMPGAGTLAQRTGPMAHLVRAGVDLVRRRRGPVRSQTTEPSPSMRQSPPPSASRVVLERWIVWPWVFP